MTVACVLRSGGDFTPAHVHALQQGVREHLAADYRFVCLTDMDVPWTCTQPLVRDWPGWWAKVELFRPGRFDGSVLYFDLDTLIVGDVSRLASYAGSFAMLADLYRIRSGKKIGESGVMAWTPGPETEEVYAAFRANPKRMMARYRGDGPFIRDHVAHVYLQDLFPRQIVSLKADARKGPPEGATVVCLHGRPRPQDPKAGWAHKLWKERAA